MATSIEIMKFINNDCFIFYNSFYVIKIVGTFIDYWKELLKHADHEFQEKGMHVSKEEFMSKIMKFPLSRFCFQEHRDDSV